MQQKIQPTTVLELKQVPFVGGTNASEGLVPHNRELKQITTAGATTAAVNEKVWGEYVSVVGQILAKRNTKMSETWAKEFKIYFI